MSASAPHLEIASLRDQLAALARERDELKVRAERAEHERNEFKKLYLLVTLELERLKRQLFGKKAETVDPAQVQLAFGPVLQSSDVDCQSFEHPTQPAGVRIAGQREAQSGQVAKEGPESIAFGVVGCGHEPDSHCT